ncbi:MAG: ribonuclease HII [Bosea sp. (in: a-proteobacteria)]
MERDVIAMARNRRILPVLDGTVERLSLRAWRMAPELPVAGIDEVGRGPLAGPVVAAAVILEPGTIPEGLADSKQLSPARRTAMFDVILASARAVSIGSASASEIDALNIRQATHLAMRRALMALAAQPALLLVDGNDTAGLEGLTGIPTQAIIKGDGKVAAIAAASIIAKVMRDRMMARLDESFPAYGFASHHGYGTPAHLAAIMGCGPCLHHRYSFAPMKERWQRA